MKSCRRCKEYDNKLKMCKLHNIQIEDVLNATYCKRYKTNVKTKEKVKCVNCKNINKNNYCFSKKRCYNFEERIKERKCINFINKKGGNK